MKKKKKYEHLRQQKRDRLQALWESGHKQKEIAKILEVDKSTIAREIKRNRRKKRCKGKTKNGPYEAGVAGHKAYLRRKYSKYQGKKINENNTLGEYIVHGLKKGWSPDEISGKMKKDKQKFYASKTAIYEWLRSNRGQYWCQYLYSKRYRKRKQKKNKTKKTLIPHRISIVVRPRGATNRTRYGHYESDTMVSAKKTASKEALSVLYERKAKYIQARKIKNLRPEINNAAITKMKQSITTIKSITFDNGIENVKHEALNIPTYFCDPYSSWQKGGVENANKMIRRFIPKGSDLADFSEEYVMMVIQLLNNKPRKSLHYKTPYEVMVEHNFLIEDKKTEVALRG